MAVKGVPTQARERLLVVFFRLCMGWTFLWAAIHHFGDDKFVPEFLSNTKTFHSYYAPLAEPGRVGLITYFVEYGHLAIGVSLICGFLVRASAPFAILLLLLYWTAHLDFPYIESVNSYLVDYHIVYCGVLAYLLMKKAGHVLGLDGWAANREFVKGNAFLRCVVG